MIVRGLQLADTDGLVYLGTCGPSYIDNSTSMHYYSADIIQYRRGFYYCTHAMAYTKWRARSLWDELAVYRLKHQEFGADTVIRQWQQLSHTYPISVATNIQWPPNTGHYGFFYQARGIFKSVIQGWA